jgi:peptide/nickel transport system permease protein
MTTARPARIYLDEPQRESLSPTQRVVKRFLRHRMAIVGGLLLLGITLFVTVGALFYSEAYANYNEPAKRLQAPSAEHLFGTDTVGRDILARTIYGGQISLLIGIFSVIVSVTIGTLFGVLSGYFGGWIDSVISRVTEAMLTIPSLLMLLMMSKFFSQSVPNINFFGRTLSGSVLVIIGIIGMTSWMTLSRIVRGQVLSLKENEYMLAARAIGAQEWRIIISHILPNTIAPVIVFATLGTASAILSEAYVSFLGLGVTPPTATWGNILNSASDYLESAPWLWFYPGLLIVLTLLGINFVGDGLRDALDPRMDKDS